MLISFCNFLTLILLSITVTTLYTIYHRLFWKRKALSDEIALSMTKNDYYYEIDFL